MFRTIWGVILLLVTLACGGAAIAASPAEFTLGVPGAPKHLWGAWKDAVRAGATTMSFGEYWAASKATMPNGKVIAGQNDRAWRRLWVGSVVNVPALAAAAGASRAGRVDRVGVANDSQSDATASTKAGGIPNATLSADVRALEAEIAVLKTTIATLEAQRKQYEGIVAGLEQRLKSVKPEVVTKFAIPWEMYAVLALLLLFIAAQFWRYKKATENMLRVNNITEAAVAKQALDRYRAESTGLYQQGSGSGEETNPFHEEPVPEPGPPDAKEADPGSSSGEQAVERPPRDEVARPSGHSSLQIPEFLRKQPEEPSGDVVDEDYPPPDESVIRPVTRSVHLPDFARLCDELDGGDTLVLDVSDVEPDGIIRLEAPWSHELVFGQAMATFGAAEGVVLRPLMTEDEILTFLRRKWHAGENVPGIVWTRESTDEERAAVAGQAVVPEEA